MTNEELALQAQHGDKGAELQLWEQIKRLVYKKALRRLPFDGSTNRFEFNDFVQSGYIAMIEAVKDFNSESGFTFTTYLSNHLKTAFACVQGIRTSRRDALLQAISIDAPQGSEDNDFSLSDTLVAPDAETSFQDMLDRMEKERIFNTVMECVDKLDPEQSETIKIIYLQGYSVLKAASIKQMPVEQVQSLKEKALRRLRSFPAVRKIRQQLFADRYTDFYLHIGLNAFQSGAGSAVELLTEKRDPFIEQTEKDLTSDMRELKIPSV